MPYRVLLIIKDKWWSDQATFPTFAAARKHQGELARQWNDCETAIEAPDGRVLSYRDSLVFMAEIAALAKQTCG